MRGEQPIVAEPPTIDPAGDRKDAAVRYNRPPMTAAGVSIIVPTYREAENIPILMKRLFAALHAAAIPAELIIVDDDSRDGADRVVAELAAEHPVRLITRTGERGLSSAVVRGFREARHDILLCMDADLSHPPETVPELVRRVADGSAEFVIGSRYAPGGATREEWGLFRRINSLGATWLARPLTTARDPMAGFFCLRRDVFARAERAGLNAIGYKIGLEILVRARCTRVAEVPIEFSDRLHGRSKLTLRQQVEYLRQLARLYQFRRPVWTCIAAAALLGLTGAAACTWLG